MDWSHERFKGLSRGPGEASGQINRVMKAKKEVGGFEPTTS